MNCLHANLVAVNGVGVLILGEPGSGKSSLSYELIKRGHRLVADDLVLVSRIKKSGLLVGKSPKTGLGLLHLRDHGVIDIKKKFGAGSIAAKTTIDVLVKIK